MFNGLSKYLKFIDKTPINLHVSLYTHYTPKSYIAWVVCTLLFIISRASVLNVDVEYKVEINEVHATHIGSPDDDKI